MTSTRSRSLGTILASAAAACLVAASSACSTVTFHVVRSCTYVRDTVLDFLQVAVAKFEQPALQLLARPVQLAQSCAYALRLAKRERPRMMPGWRMCPST